MSRCISCGKENAVYIHNNGDAVCEDCLGYYFTCPDCGILFEQEDMVNGDQGNGFCKECSNSH